MKDAMRFNQFLKETLDHRDYDHFSANMNTPLRENAFDISDNEKINFLIVVSTPPTAG